MKTVFKILKKIVLIGLGVYAALFAVFFFDLDGKALFYGVEPFLCRHYDRMERRDPLKQKYDMNNPNYKYLSDADPKNTFDIEKCLSTKLKPRPDEAYEAHDLGPIDPETTA